MAKDRKSLPFGVSSTDDNHLIFKAPETAVTTSDLQDTEITHSLD